MSNEIGIRLTLSGAGQVQQGLQGVAADMQRTGVSAAQMNAAMRMVPAQMTDIVTSLASGQQPLTVLLQQGGQLKDMFGGIGPAAQALGKYVAGLVNPFTVSAAAAGLVFMAFEHGRKEAEALNLSLLKTGNITGTTTGQINEMAKALGSGEFTRGAAAEALAALAGTGAVASKNLQGLTQTTLDMQRYLGVSVQDTAKQFKALGDEPVKASLQLNDSLHYLTKTQYEQIKSLEEHGQKTQAASIAQQAYADAVKKQTDYVRSNLGYLEASWDWVAIKAKKGWDAMRGIGRPETSEDRLSAARKKLENMQIGMDWETGSSSHSQQQIDLQKELVRYLEREVQVTKDTAAAAAAKQRQEEAGIKWAQEGDKYLTRELKLKKEIAEIESLGKAAGLDSGEIARRVALARQDYDKSVASANSDALVAAAQGNAKRYSDYYKQELDEFRLSTADYLGKIRDLERNALQVERRAVAGQRPTTADDRIRQQSRLSELDAQIGEVNARYQRALEDEDSKSQQVLERLRVAAGKSLDPLAQAGEAFVSQYGAIMRRAAVDGNEPIIEAGRAVWETMANKAQFDSAKRLYDDLFSKLSTELDAVRQVADMDGGLFAHIDAAGKSEEIRQRLLPSIQEALDQMRQFKGVDLVSDKAVVDASANLRKLSTSVDPYFKKLSDGIETSLTDALMRGFESGKDFGKNLIDTLKNMFSTLVLRPVIQAIINPVAGAIAGSVGVPGMAQAGQGGSGGSIISLASSASSAYSALTNGISASIEAGFSKLMSSSFGESLGLAQSTGYTTGSGVQYGLNGTGSSIGSALGYAGNALAGYAISKGLSGGYQVGSGKVVDAITLAASAYFGPIAGVAAAAFNRAFGKKLADQGLQGTFGGAAGFSGNSYQFYKGGWFSSDKTKTGALDPAVSAGLADQFRALQASTGLMATTLGLGTKAISGFTSSIKISFQGLTEEQIQSRLSEEFTKVSDSLAAVTLGTQAYTRTGETASQTLQRLSSSLSTVNGTFDVLGRTLYAASLSGGNMASSLVDLMGGLDQYKSTTTAYYEAFYTDAERTATATRQLTASLSALGLSLPGTRDEYRRLVEAQNLSTDAGRATYAALMGLSGAFAALTPSIDDAFASVSSLLNSLISSIKSITESISSSMAAVAQARDSIGNNQKTLSYADLVLRIGGIMVSPPSQDALDKARNNFGAADLIVTNQKDNLVSKTAFSQQQVKDAQLAYKTIYESAKSAYDKALTAYGQYSPYNGGPTFASTSYFGLATPDQVLVNDYAGGFSMPGDGYYSNTVWGAYNYTHTILPKIQSQADAVVETAKTSLQAAQNTLAAAKAAMTQAEADYITSMQQWVQTAGISVAALDKLRESTLDYYQQQEKLAELMLTSAAGLRGAIRQAWMSTVMPSQSLQERLNDYDKSYTLALSSYGATKAGYADQLASALPQLSQDLASMSTSRADWAVAVARLSDRAAKVADQLDATAPKNYQAEANALLSAIDAKLLAVNASATSAEAVISKAVTDGATRTATGLQQIINQLQGKSVSAFAKGGVFTNSVVNTPTMAPMALFGEAGDEAIMPLSRGPGGVLGVRAFGSTGGGTAEASTMERLLRDLVSEVQRLNAQFQDAKRTSDQARQENNVGNSKIADSADRLARLVERWDVVGLPATATT